MDEVGKPAIDAKASTMEDDNEDMDDVVAIVDALNGDDDALVAASNNDDVLVPDDDEFHGPYIRKVFTILIPAETNPSQTVRINGVRSNICHKPNRNKTDINLWV